MQVNISNLTSILNSLLLTEGGLNDINILDYIGTNQVSNTLGISEGLFILILATLSGLYLRFIYKKFAITYSSLISFGNTLLILSISVSALIAVVKTSLALSLGLVGALSVIRFRSAIKEPYNLAIMLFAICNAIAIGASQFVFSLLILFFGSSAIYLSRRSYLGNAKRVVEEIDTISLILPFDISLGELYDMFSKKTHFFSLISLDQKDKESIVLVINVKFIDQESLIQLKDQIFQKYPSSSFSFYNSPTV